MTATPKRAGMHPTAQQLCDMHGISRRMFFNALKVHREGCKELNAAVLAGTVSMNLALSIIRFDHDSQRLILAELPRIKPRKQASFIAMLHADWQTRKGAAQ